MDPKNFEKNLNLTEKALEKNKDVDVSAILALSRDDEARSFAKEYIFSVIFAPLGIYYFIKYFFYDYHKQALICLILTIIMTIVYWKLSVLLLGPLTSATSSSSLLGPAGF